MTTTEAAVWVNGVRDQHVHATDRGLAYGDGVFETMRFEHGSVALLDLHKQRLLTGCQRLAIAGVEAALHKSLSPVFTYLGELPAAQAGQAYRVKLIVTRGCGGAGFRPSSAETPPTIIVYALPLVDAQDKSELGVQLHLCRWRLALMPLLAGIKHLNRLEYVMAAQELAAEPVAVQGLLTDSNGSVVEALHHNVFIVKRGELMTPKLSMCGVKGVMRRHIVATLAPALNLSVNERELRIDDLITADEIFLSNAVHGVWPVVGFRDRDFAPGAITRALQSAVAQLWQGDDAS